MSETPDTASGKLSINAQAQAQGLSTRETSPSIVKLAQKFRTHEDPEIRSMAMSLISQAEAPIAPSETREDLLKRARELRANGAMSDLTWDLIERYDSLLALSDAQASMHAEGAPEETYAGRDNSDAK